MGEKKHDCGCLGNKPHKIPVAEYDRNNQLDVSYINVCDKCRQWYSDLDLILTDEQIAKYFGK